MNSFKQFLLENRINWLKKNIDHVDTSHDHLAQHHEPHDVIDHFASKADPSQKKVYTQWIMNRYKDKDFRQEDHPRIHQALSSFEEHKSKLDKRDINQYKSLSDVEDAVEPHVETAKAGDPFQHPDHEKLLKSGGAQKIHSGKNLDVYNLHSHEAACHYGKGTSWCVSKGSEEYDDATFEDSKDIFHDYKDEGPLYLMHSKKDNRRHLIHFPTEQFANERDIMKPLHELVKKYPEMKDVPHFHRTDHAYWFSRNESEAKNYLIAKRESPKHPELPEHHIRDLIDSTHPGGYEHQTLATNQGLSKKSVIDLLEKSNHSPEVTIPLVMHHGDKLDTHHVDDIVDSNMKSKSPERSYSFHQLLMNKRTAGKVSDESIKKMIDYGAETDPSVLNKITKTKMSADNIDHFLSKGSKTHSPIASYMAELPKQENWSDDHEKKALSLGHGILNSAIAESTKNPKTIDHLLDHYTGHEDNLSGLNKYAKDRVSISSAILRNPNVKPHHIDRLLKNPEQITTQGWHMLGMKDSKIKDSVEDRHHAEVFKHGGHEARLVLARNPRVSSDVLHQIIDKSSSISGLGAEDLIHHVSNNPSLAKDHVDKLLGMSSGFHRRIAENALVARDGRVRSWDEKGILDSSHVDTIAKRTDDAHTATRIMSHPDIRDEHVHAIIDNFTNPNNPRVSSIVPSFPRRVVNDDHLDKMVASHNLRTHAIMDHDLKPRHIDHVLEHGNTSDLHDLMDHHNEKITKSQKKKWDERLDRDG